MSTGVRYGSKRYSLIGLSLDVLSEISHVLDAVETREGMAAVKVFDATDAAWHSPRGPLEVTEGDDEYETVAASQTDQALGATGAAGDYLKRIIVVVSTSGANGTCSIKDGAGSAIPLVPASTPLGVHVIELGMTSAAGAWSVTTGSAATAIAIGDFT